MRAKVRGLLSFLRSTIIVLILLPFVLVASNYAMDAITYALRDHCARVDDSAYICMRVTSPLDRQDLRRI